jgi:hypothetical protein
MLQIARVVSLPSFKLVFNVLVSNWRAKTGRNDIMLNNQAVEDMSAGDNIQSCYINYLKLCN